MDGSVRSRISANMIAFGFVIIVLCLQAKPTDCKAAEHDEIDWKTSDYPFMAFVSRLKKPYEKDEFKTCSGCLVTQNQVITSAYCTYDQRRNVSTQVEVRHPVFCKNGTTSFVRRNATSITYMDGYENDLNRQMAIINLNPLDMTECKAKIVKIEINRYASRKVRLVSAGVYWLGILTWSEDSLVKWNASIVSLELMKMYYGSLEYGIVFDDGGTMDKTDYAAAILDLESNNFLGFVIDKNPEFLTQSVYTAFYFYPELEEFIKKHFGEDGYVPQRLNVSHTDESVTYNQRLNVSKPAKFSYTLREVEWTDHPYIVQVCNSQTKQIYSATLVDNNTVVTTPKCITDRTTGGLNDTFVVTHYAQNRITEEWKLFTRHVTKWWIPEHRSCGEVSGPVHIDYIFLGLSSFDFQGEYDLTIVNKTKSNQTKTSQTELNLTGTNLTGMNLTDTNLTDTNLTGTNLTGLKPTELNQETKRFYYVSLVSFAKPKCNINVKPKLIQLDTIATYNGQYHDKVYDCHIFDSTTKNVNIGIYPLNPIGRVYDTNYSGYHNGIHNFHSNDYSTLFDGSATLLDYESRNLLGIGFAERCVNRLSFNNYCRTEVTKSINVVKAVKYEPNLECPPDDGSRINSLTGKIGDNQFMAMVKNVYLNLRVHCVGSLVTRNRLITSSTCLKDRLKTLNFTHLQVNHTSFVKAILLETTRNVTNISFIGPHQHIAILHLASFEDEQFRHIQTVNIEFNSFIPRKFVKFASFSRDESYSRFELFKTGFKTINYYYTKSTEVQTATIDMIEYSKRLNGPGHQFAVPLKATYLSPYDWGAPVLDPITENVLAVITRHEPYSLEPVFIASYFHPDLEVLLKAELGNDAKFAYQDPILENHFINETLSTKALDVEKPEDFNYILSEVPWDGYPYIARICNEKTRKICTATLVGRNLAITSSRCLSRIPLESVTFTQYVKKRNADKWKSITRNVISSGIVRHDDVNCTRARKSVGYASLQLSPVDDEFEVTTTRNESQPADRQFRYARLLSVAPSLSLENLSEWSCSSTDEFKLIQLNTLVSLDQEYENQMYDCPIFSSTAIKSTIANRSRIDSLVYLFDDHFHRSHAIDYSLLITDGSALFDYSTDQLLGIGYDESCDDYEDFCMLSTIRPINITKVARLVPYTSTTQPDIYIDGKTTSENFSLSSLLFWLCAFFTILGTTIHIVFHCMRHYKNIDRNAFEMAQLNQRPQINPDRPDDQMVAAERRQNVIRQLDKSEYCLSCIIHSWWNGSAN